MSAQPEGWYYEAPDPEVGLFGGGWVHEDCESEDEPTVEEVAARKEGDTRVTTYKVTCACGASMQVEDSDYDPDEMPTEAFRDEEHLVDGEAFQNP